MYHNRSWINFQPQAGTIWNLLKLAEDDLDSLVKDDSNWEIRRTRIKTHLSKLGSVLFAIQRLPDDLLLEIFGYCIKAGVAFQGVYGPEHPLLARLITFIEMARTRFQIREAI
ncbi:hypothetical protein BT96DRAFT_949383 [Gymnopus androsaceus JB14]|uniref:Uncharacterized protein n=1 Tax=Gymnopus androsaceus JB14 TaxID=1447944 RepID=A0A6A4GL35_9AGAR|nr:hypothetical protein BT96DRAFT_949383 [Gymnopus androsaceus JB14]